MLPPVTGTAVVVAAFLLALMSAFGPCPIGPRLVAAAGPVCNSSIAPPCFTPDNLVEESDTPDKQVCCFTGQPSPATARHHCSNYLFTVLGVWFHSRNSSGL
jgi:hypothetical protein